MPIPFIIGAAAIGAGLFGAKKAYDAHETNELAKDINRSAKKSVDKAKTELQTSRNACQKSLKHLGAAKLAVLNNAVMPFVRSFKKIHHIDLRNSEGLDELSKFNISKEELAEMEKMGSLAETMVSGTVGGVAAGALTALGAYGAATTLGVASTGAAIAGLSGVAATNATLAFLGGGSLAAGGLGMAGGMAVLGGLVAGPALAVMGFVLNSKAEENFENAMANEAKANEIVAQYKTACTVCDSIKSRCNLFTNALDKLKTQLKAAVLTVEGIVSRYEDGSGTADFRKFSRDEQNSLAAACSLAKSVKSILDTPILKDNGELTSESKTMARKLQANC